MSDPDCGELLPLSMEQEFFYAARLAAPRRRVSIVRGLDIRGSLDADALLSALDVVVARHEGLRVRIAHSAGGEPCQRILRPGEETAPIICEEVRCSSRQQFEAYARAIARRDMQERWNPVAEPLYRLHLLRRSEDENIMLATFDHLAFDERAVNNFEHDLWQACTGGAASDPAPSLGRCVLRQWERYGARARTVNHSYWARKYASASPVFQLSGARYTGAPAENKRRMLAYRPDAGMIRELRSACQAAGCTLFEMSVAVFGYLVFGLTLQDRISIYIPIDSRETREKDVIGMFAGTRLLVLSRRDAGSVEAALSRVRAEVMRAMVHRHVNGETETAATSGDYSRWNLAPQRQLVVNYFRHGADLPAERAGAGLRVTPVRYAPSATGGTAYLGLYVDDDGDEVVITLYYSAGYLSEDAASELLRKFDQQLQRATSGAGGAQPEPGAPAEGTPGHGQVWGEGEQGLSPLRDRDGTVCLHADLAEVRAALVSQPFVAGARLRVVPGRDGGDEITAAVSSPGRLTSRELRDACLSWPQATQYMVPPTTVSAGASQGQDATSPLARMRPE